MEQPADAVDFRAGVVVMSAQAFFEKARALRRFESSPVSRAWDRGTPQERKALAALAGMGSYIPEWLWETMTLDQQLQARQSMASEWRIHDKPWRELTPAQRERISMSAKGAAHWLAGLVAA